MSLAFTSCADALSLPPCHCISCISRSKIVWAMAKLDLRLHKLVAKAKSGHVVSCFRKSLLCIQVSDEALQKLPEFEPQQLPHGRKLTENRQSACAS